MSSLSFAIIIPARFASSRFPGKPLVPLTGAGGMRKTLIQRSWECASLVPGCSGLWVATDDERIADEVRRFGGQVVMTSVDCANGTERCADAIATLGEVADVIVNLQGDAPLSPGFAVERLVQRLGEDERAVVATPAVRCSPGTLAHLLEDAAEGRVGGTTAVFNRQGRALYFSKRILPYVAGRECGSDTPVFLHIGMYAYRPAALRDYALQQPSTYEKAEGLEQLRFLDMGAPVSVVALDQLDWNPLELNNPSDVPTLERILADLQVQ
jgi:3-deoxy-manno-octulosonate cytidylyltransferase (CMP-KDO synthetase)